MKLSTIIMFQTNESPSARQWEPNITKVIFTGRIAVSGFPRREADDDFIVAIFYARHLQL